MSSNVFVYDPTKQDTLSKVRGIGRYLELLHDFFASEWEFGAKAIPSENTDVLINPFFNILEPQNITKRYAKKQIAVIHDLIPLKYPSHFPIGLRGKLRMYQNKRLLHLYDHFVTDSEASKKDIVSLLNIPASQITVVYPTLSLQMKEPSTKEELQLYIPNKYCLYVGDATWNKNIVTIARTVKKANVTCVFVGKVFKTHEDLNHPWQKELKEFMEEVRGDRRFIFPGFIPNYQLIKLYKQSRCNILLSQDEGFGFSYLESAFYGCPSVLSDIPVFREIAQDSAVYSQTLDYSEAANRIEEFYFDENKRKLLSFKAQERAKTFSAENFKTQWRSLLSR